MGRHGGLKSPCLRAYGFESRAPHDLYSTKGYFMTREEKLAVLAGAGAGGMFWVGYFVGKKRAWNISRSFGKAFDAILMQTQIQSDILDWIGKNYNDLNYEQFVDGFNERITYLSIAIKNTEV